VKFRIATVLGRSVTWNVKRMEPARIIVLVIAVAAAGLAVYFAGGSVPPPQPAEPVAQMETVDVLVANGDIEVGQTVAAQDLRWATWPAVSAGASLIRRTRRPDAVDQLAGSISRAVFSSGEPIREAKLIRANGSGYMAAVLSKGMRAVSVEVNTETGAGGFVMPNDRVDVLLSRRDKVAEKATGVETPISEIILFDIRVLAIDQTVEDKDKTRIAKTVTLELSPRQAKTLVRARHSGVVSLALRPLLDAASGRPAPEADDQSSGAIDIVRFGVKTTTR
jgi:pilus assembly protein CpaB